MSVRDYETPVLCAGCGERITDPEGAARCSHCGALTHNGDCEHDHIESSAECYDSWKHADGPDCDDPPPVEQERP